MSSVLLDGALWIDLMQRCLPGQHFAALSAATAAELKGFILKLHPSPEFKFLYCLNFVVIIC